MTRQDIQTLVSLAQGKGELAARHPGRFLTRAALAGGFLFVATLFSSLASAWFYVDAPGVARVLGAFTFPMGLMLIVLLGGELFTGCNLVMGVALYEGAVNLRQTLLVWTAAWCGNFLGILLSGVLFAGSGANGELMASYLALTVPAKFAVPWYRLVLRGALCNFCVCLAVFAGVKLKSECAKIALILPLIAAFILASLEHSVANMAYFTLYTLLVDTAHLGEMALNLLWVTLGNILGGAVLLALPLWYAAGPSDSFS